MSLKIFCTFVAYCAVWKTGDEHWLVWQCWSNMWLSEVLRLLGEGCDSAMTVGAVMDYLACWWTLKWGAWGLGYFLLDSILKSIRNWYCKPLQSGVMKMSIDEIPLWVFLFVCFWGFLQSHRVNTMAIGDKLDKKGGICLIHRPRTLFSFNLRPSSCDEVHGTIHA